jgi:release factor glutamine methyltransferase
MPDGVAPVRRILGQATDRLRVEGVLDSRREALRIWSELSGDRQPAGLLDDAAADEALVTRFERAIERRVRGEPLPYVIGIAGFRQLSLRSDRRALIPRPETEGLVDLLLQRVRSGVAADVGTGSGCLALSLALEGAFSSVVGVDRSRDAIALARENAGRQLTRAPVFLVEGDLCRPLGRGAVDALVSNPPYLTADEHAALDPSVREWEPALALVGGDDGMEITRRLLDEGREVLRPGGWVALEVDCSRAALAAGLATERGWENASIHQDLFGRERYLLAQRSETL